jgi:hypothetical protein
VKRLLSIAAAACMAAGGSVALAAPRGSAPSRARLRAFACHVALDPVGRAVSVQAVMRPVPGTQSMQLRFDLLERRAGVMSYSEVRGGDLGMWVAPADPTLGTRSGDVWILSHPVRDLVAPASYRFRVVFRWLGAGGRLLASVERSTRACRQPELRPDLVVRSIVVAPIADHPKEAAYRVTIANRGATAAGPFTLVFAPADRFGVSTRTIGRLGAHRTRTELFTGRACSAMTAPTVTVDPQHEVDDPDLANNVLLVPPTCPRVTSR